VAGGLTSDETSLRAGYRKLAIYIRILNGEKPADLPVQQATVFEAVVDVKAAKARSMTIPLGILLRPDEGLSDGCNAALHESAIGATFAFSRRPLSCAYRPFIGTISKGSSGSTVTRRASSHELRLRADSGRTGIA
jgi:hypothetical protein